MAPPGPASAAGTPLAAPTLLLFDVDGTLLSGATRAHSESLYEALREVHGVDARAHVAGVSPAGRTDGEIARLLLLASGVDARTIDERADDVREACCREYAQRCPSDLTATVLPGVSDLLAWLGERRDVALSVVTGNYEPVARLKLKRAGLGARFPAGQGGFGSDSEDRAALPAIARRRAGSGGVSHARERTIVIGDTPRDIACARADGVRCVAVASGSFDAARLAGADAVAADAVALAQVLAGILD